MINKKLTITDVAQLCDVERTAVLQWITDGKLKAEKEGDGKFQKARYLVDESELQKFLVSDVYTGHPEKIDSRIFARIPCLEDCWPFNLILVILNGGEDLEDGEKIADISSVNIRKFQELVHMLTDREKRVIELRYQFGLSLSETAAAFDLSKERIRQIMAKAERKLISWVRSGVCNMVPVQDYNLLKTQYTSLQIRYDLLAEELDKKPDEPVSANEKIAPDPDCISIGELDLSVRGYNCLMRAGIATLGDIIRFDKGQEVPDDSNNYRGSRNWLGIRNLGCKSLYDVACKMYEYSGYKIRYCTMEGYSPIVDY